MAHRLGPLVTLRGRRVMLKRQTSLDTIVTRTMGPALRVLRVAGNRSH
jgi:hypothetical protein